MKRVLALIPAAAVALIASSTALANSLTCGHGRICNRPPSQRGTLPFAGLGLGTIVAIAALLIVAGLTLRWASARRP